jgi:hypothetical protein
LDLNDIIEPVKLLIYCGEYREYKLAEETKQLLEKFEEVLEYKIVGLPRRDINPRSNTDYQKNQALTEELADPSFAALKQVLSAVL